MKVVYIAGKFTGPTAWAIAENVRHAERWALKVAEAGAMPLCPHANSAHFHGLITPEFWYDGTLELLKRCDALVLIPGWRASMGSIAERGHCLIVNKPVFDADLDGHGDDELFMWIQRLNEAP